MTGEKDGAPIMFTLEMGVARGLRRYGPVDPEFLPELHIAAPDPVFLAATAWLLCEGGADALAAFAAADRRVADRPARAALAEFAGDPPNHEREKVMEDLGRAYFEDVGYPATIAGALTAVCDLYFGRIAAGAVHPAVGVGCVAFYSWMTENVPGHDVVQACEALKGRWMADNDRPAVEMEMRALAHAWRRQHRSKVPTRPPAP